MLPINCRNTVKIARHCAGLVHESVQVRDGAPTGDDPEMIRVRSIRAAFEAGKKVRYLCGTTSGGLRPSQVAVLAPGSHRQDWPKDFTLVKATRNFDAWRRNEAVLIESWSRFKGLEADAVIIIEEPAEDAEREAPNQYVAPSRAKHLLTIVQVA